MPWLRLSPLSRSKKVHDALIKIIELLTIDHFKVQAPLNRDRIEIKYGTDPLMSAGNPDLGIVDQTDQWI